MSNTTQRGAGIMIVNNTREILNGEFHEAILDAILGDGVLCEELADVLKLSPVEGYPGRWRVDYADDSKGSDPDRICESCCRPLLDTEGGPCDGCLDANAVDDLEICADCEASTAAGTPDPHVCGSAE